MAAVPEITDTWIALEREAEIAAEHLAIGVTALGRSNYAQDAYYGQAFFALSVGLERGAKLALLLDHVATTGAFPSNNDLRKFGHEIDDLLAKLDAIAVRRGLSSPWARFPTGDVADAIRSILTSFANNATRYFNLDLVTSATRIAREVDPVADWWNRVVVPIIEALPEKSVERVAERAGQVAQLLAGHALTLFTTEAGEVMTDEFTASFRTGLTELARPKQQLAVLQFARTMGEMISALGDLARQKRGADIPYLNEAFAIFNNDDKMLSSRKTWSIYKP